MDRMISVSRSYRSTLFTLVLAASVGACDEVLPTATDPGLIPVTPTTVEVRLPFSAFGRNVQTLEGFGRVADLNAMVVSAEDDGVVDARTLVRFARFPQTVSIPNAGGIIVTDTALTYLGGRIAAVVDTAASTRDREVLLVAGALQENWDQRSATWTHAVDTVGDVVRWSEAGAGPVQPIDFGVWDPEAGDTVYFDVDSATVNAWADTTDGSRGLRLSTIDAGVRLELTSVELHLDIRSNVNPDTLVVDTVFGVDQLFVYDPPPPPTEGEFRVGGAPSWRTTFRMELPEELTGPPELCEAAGCPFPITSESVNYAALVLSSATSPDGFQPDDSLAIDIRPVLSEETLPKSPIGSSLVGLLGATVPPEYFGDDPTGEVSVPITGFVQDLVRGTDRAGDPAPNSLAILSVFEPLSMEIMTFHGPGHEKEPVLRVILTTRVGVPLR